MSQSIDFRSDNVGTVSPEILDAVRSANVGPAAAYGEDEWTQLLNARFGELFENKVAVFPVSTGTAANAIALSTLSPPYGAIYCHETAHVHTSEIGATELFSGGAKLVLIGGTGHRLHAGDVERAVAQAGRGQRHKVQPAAISVTQATEYGTVYRLDEIAAIGELARKRSLSLHMDGARFANALATLGCTPADMTWRIGVKALSFGATKNGGMSCDAIVLFDFDRLDDLAYRLRRAGQTWSKMRFAAAQLIAYVSDGLYLRSARRANALATRLADGLRRIPSCSVVAPVEANEVFVRLPEGVADQLAAEGFQFYLREQGMIRLVCRMDGAEGDVDRLLTALQPACSGSPSRAAGHEHG
jgi:threonine aldolase